MIQNSEKYHLNERIFTGMLPTFWNALMVMSRRKRVLFAAMVGRIYNCR